MKSFLNYKLAIIRLQGGLGNQMFQYAFAYSLSKTTKVRIVFDISHYSHPDSRKFELQSFGIEIPKSLFLTHLFIPDSSSIFLKILRKIIKLKKIPHRQFDFDKRYYDLSFFNYMEGYWQSERYFFSCRSELLKLFDFSSIINSETISYTTLIQSSESVAIHIRRGDYLTDKSGLFKVCDLMYYQKALTWIKRHVKNPRYFIFSDDISFCKTASLELPDDTVFVSLNTLTSSLVDMYLMSRCCHNVIANSSYSWWAAWLNTNEDKFVIAPKDWFADPNISVKDLLPNSWICL